MTSPSISVVITAHDRTKYLLSAVRSVRASIPGGEEAEVVIVANFRDAHLEEELSGLRARTLLVTEKAVGAKLAAAIATCQGEVLCFLEDDDRFLPSKLGAVHTAFEANPRLVYLHHNVQPIDDQGRPLPAASYRGREILGLAGLVSLQLSVGTHPEALRTLPVDPYFTASAIAVRRSVVQGRTTWLRQVNLVPDAFLFFAALLTGGDLLLDGRPLSEYRVHAANVSSADATDPEEFFARMSSWSQGLDPSLKVVEQMVSEKDQGILLESIRGVRAVQRVYAVLRDLSSTRRDMREALEDLRRVRSSYSWRTHADVRSAARLFLLSPGLVRWLYRRRKSQERSSAVNAPGGSG